MDYIRLASIKRHCLNTFISVRKPSFKMDSENRQLFRFLGREIIVSYSLCLPGNL